MDDATHACHSLCRQAQAASFTSSGAALGTTPAPSASAAASAGLTPRNARTMPFSIPGGGARAARSSALRFAFSFLYFLVDGAFRASATIAVAAATVRRHSAADIAGSGLMPGAGGGGEYGNPGDMGRTLVCAAPTWYAHDTMVDLAPAATSTALLLRAMISQCRKKAGGAPGRSAKEKVATRSQGSGRATATRMRPRRLAAHSSPNDSCSVLCTRGGGGPRHTRAASGCHDTCSASLPSSPRRPSTKVYASACTATSTLVGSARLWISQTAPTSAV
mmetsp:Transcript_24044/g.59625  ORF Transcript_24044/g.59625 Transcript_24044/m.59625 type:complete len:277 (+) Transcript_24044:145-975(+)